MLTTAHDITLAGTGLRPAGQPVPDRFGNLMSTLAFAPAATDRLPDRRDIGRHLQLAEDCGLIGSAREAVARVAALRERDRSLAEHSCRVAVWCAWLADMTACSARERAKLVSAAMLHAVLNHAGKDSLSLKSEPASAGETAATPDAPGVPALPQRRRSDEVERIVAESQIRFDAPTDDSSPRESDIDAAPRLLAVADAFDSLTSAINAPRAISRHAAVRKLQEAAGTQFDPDHVALFVNGLELLSPSHEMPDCGLPELPAPTARSTRIDEPPPPDPFADSVRLFSELLNHATDAVCVVDDELNVRLWNHAAEQLSGRSATERVGAFWAGEWLLLPSELLERLDQRTPAIAKCVESGESRVERGCVINTRGAEVPVEVRLIPLRDGRGRVAGGAVILRDVSREISLQSENETLRRASRTDPLTQVVNRAGFEPHLREQLEALRSRRTSCSLILADLDHFKSVNDTYGHPVGDKVLRLFAEILTRHCRPGDLVARYGGEEFAVVLASCDAANAALRAEQMRRELAATEFPELKGRRLTASFGVTVADPTDTEAAMFARADAALYNGKRGGRDRVETLLRDGSKNAKELIAGLQHECEWLLSSARELIDLKLLGFISEHRATLRHIETASIEMEIGRYRWTDRFRIRRDNLPVKLELRLSHPNASERLRVNILVRPLTPVSRTAFDARCDKLLKSLRSHLFGEVVVS